MVCPQKRGYRINGYLINEYLIKGIPHIKATITALQSLHPFFRVLFVFCGGRCGF